MKETTKGKRAGINIKMQSTTTAILLNGGMDFHKFFSKSSDIMQLLKC